MGRNRFVGKGSNQGLYVDMFSLRCLLSIKVRHQVGNWMWVSWSLRRSELEMGIVSIWNLKPARDWGHWGADLKRSSLRTKPCSRSGIESAGIGSAQEEAERKQAVSGGDESSLVTYTQSGQFLGDVWILSLECSFPFQWFSIFPVVAFLSSDSFSFSHPW